MTRYNLLLVLCTPFYLAASEDSPKNGIELKLVMSVDSNSVKIPLSDRFETISTLIEQYKQNDAHPFANVVMYALREGKVSAVGRISTLQAMSLGALSHQQMLFVSYTQNKKTVNVLCAGTSTVKDVNLLRKFIESDQTPTKETSVKSAFDAELDKLFAQAKPFEEFLNFLGSQDRKS